MKQKTVLFVLIASMIITSCVKETYNMDKLSGETALSPGFSLAAVKGEVTLSDVVEPNDTIVFDNDLLKLVISEDSIFEFKVEDFYTSFPAVSFEQTTPVASITVNDIRDTLKLDPGDDIKLKQMKVLTGNVDYTFTSWCSFDVQLDLLATSIDDEGSPLTESINIPAGAQVTGSINLDGVLVNFDSNPAMPYNQVPLEYDITVLDAPPGYDPSDSVRVKLDMAEPEYDYAIGYFGNLMEEIPRDTMDLGTEEFFSRLSGSIHITSPSITVNYSNSFGLPLRLTADITGRNDEEEISLNRDPINIDYPTSAVNREVSNSFTIDKDNSSLPELISMFPYEVEIAGSGEINPDGETMDNILFSDSYFRADIDVEVPMEFRIANLQLSDTIDLGSGDDNSDDFNPGDAFESINLRLYLENGFPLGASVLLELYDSQSMTVLETIDTGDLFTPAPVDANGRVTAASTGTAEIVVDNDFINAMENADKMLITFTLNTTDNGTKDVKIYSDYSILFKVAVVVKTNLNLNINSEDE